MFMQLGSDLFNKKLLDDQRGLGMDSGVIL